jgi:hypothetical protein
MISYYSNKVLAKDCNIVRLAAKNGSETPKLVSAVVYNFMPSALNYIRKLLMSQNVAKSFPSSRSPMQ